MKRIINLINRVYNEIISLGVSNIIAKKELQEISLFSGKRKDCKNIDLWVAKWGGLGRVNKDYYRIFSNYIGEDINIVPDDICHNIIEPILNPKRYLSAYEDKCLFDKMLWSSFHRVVTPTTYIRNIEGAYYDYSYLPIEFLEAEIKAIPGNINRLIVKTSIDSSSGRGIAFINRDIDGIFKDSVTNEVFSEEYLIRYFQKNYVVQRVMSQSAFMSQFCGTSVNTIRIAVYRSVKTNKPIVLNSIVRIGKDGSLVDNAHAGGMFVGVNKEGVLGQYFCNQYGLKSTKFNGIDLTSKIYQIPDYPGVEQFAKDVALALPHSRLLALDIMLDQDNNPVLLEYNIRAFSVWLFQFTNGSGFGDYTDEIIDYCLKHKNESTRVSVIF